MKKYGTFSKSVRFLAAFCVCVFFGQGISALAWQTNQLAPWSLVCVPVVSDINAQLVGGGITNYYYLGNAGAMVNTGDLSYVNTGVVMVGLESGLGGGGVVLSNGGYWTKQSGYYANIDQGWLWWSNYYTLEGYSNFQVGVVAELQPCLDLGNMTNDYGYDWQSEFLTPNVSSIGGLRYYYYSLDGVNWVEYASLASQVGATNMFWITSYGSNARGDWNYATHPFAVNWLPRTDTNFPAFDLSGIKMRVATTVWWFSNYVQYVQSNNSDFFVGADDCYILGQLTYITNSKGIYQHVKNWFPCVITNR